MIYDIYIYFIDVSLYVYIYIYKLVSIVSYTVPIFFEANDSCSAGMVAFVALEVLRGTDDKARGEQPAGFKQEDKDIS